MYSREYKIKEIVSLISVLKYEIEIRNDVLKLYDINILSENFLTGLLNIIYDYNLVNANEKKDNNVAIDLADDKNKIAFQVTSDNSTSKIQNTIDKFVEYGLQNKYKTLNIFIIKKKQNQVFGNLDKKGLNFNVSNVYDWDDLIKKMNESSFSINKLYRIYEYLNSELQTLNSVNENSIPKEITPIPKIAKEDIVGREDDLKNLRKSLLENKKIALINGMGGIGKTTLASVYITEYYSEYSHIVWLTLENNLNEAIISNYSLLTNLKINSEKSDVMVEACLNELRKLENEKPNLLILDNANKNLSAYYNKLPGPPHWHTLVTSREKISPFHIIDLDFLSEEEAINLFKKYCNKYPDNEIKEIVNKVEFHTLTIEILSKSANKNHWDFNTVINALSIDAKTDIDIKHSNNKAIDRIKSYLTSIFDLSNICDKEVWLLKQFVALPNEWIKSDFLTELLQIDKLEWNDEFFLNLENLYEKGYLQKNENLDSFKMHPVLSDVFLTKLNPTVDNLKQLIEKVTSLISVDQSKDNPVEKFIYMQYGDSLLKIFRGNIKSEIYNLQMSHAFLYKEIGNFKKSRDFVEELLKFDNTNYGKNNPHIATCQSNLALVYKDLGDYEKARELLEKSLKSDIESFREKHPNFAIRQSNLALVYKHLGDYEKARELLEKSLKSDIENFGEKHPNVANRQSNLALVYKDLGDYEKARVLLEKALKTDIENFGENHPNVARSQSNLALVYKDLGDYEKARKLLERALKTDRENFWENHPYVATCQSNLAMVYNHLGDYKKARELLEKALKSAIVYFGENHPNVTTSQSNLALVYKDLGEYEIARILLEKALKSDIVNFGENHPNVAIRKNNLASVYYNLGNFNESYDLFLSSYEIYLNILGDSHPKTINSKKWLDIVKKKLNK